jgi:hypothetical protein
MAKLRANPGIGSKRAMGAKDVGWILVAAAVFWLICAQLRIKQDGPKTSAPQAPNPVARSENVKLADKWLRSALAKAPDDSRVLRYYTSASSAPPCALLQSVAKLGHRAVYACAITSHAFAASHPRGSHLEDVVRRHISIWTLVSIW